MSDNQGVQKLTTNIMSDNQSNNKQIAKNTLMLYIRMFFLMAVNLYTSRVTLEALGVDDYGVYNAVAGFIAMFAMISGSLSGSISRYITYILGQGNNQRLHDVFSTSVFIMLGLAFIIVVLVESLGVWFLNSHMSIPEGREVAANWVLQFALLTLIFNLWSTPYNATLIAHEKMDAFAYIGIFEGCATLLIAFLIIVSPIDTLIYYALLMLLLAIVVRIIYALYCKKHFEECTLSWHFDIPLFKEMFSFAGWNFIGFTSGILRDQGINILFNVYNGPVVNAARGLAMQVNTALTKFSQSFYTAVQPQITKSYAVGNIEESHSLVLRSSRLAYFLLMLISIPVIAEADYILALWLKDVPEHTVMFVRIIIINSLIESLSHPLIYLMLATGNIKKYQIIVGSINLLIFPLAWGLLLLGYKPEIVQSSIILFSIVALTIRLVLLKQMTGFSIRRFLKSTILKCSLVTVLTCVTPIIICCQYHACVKRLIVDVLVTELIGIILVYMIGLQTDERNMINNKLNVIVRK